MLRQTLINGCSRDSYQAHWIGYQDPDGQHAQPDAETPDGFFMFLIQMGLAQRV
jgi:hypothetical protein